MFDTTRRSPVAPWGLQKKKKKKRKGLYIFFWLYFGWVFFLNRAALNHELLQSDSRASISPQSVLANPTPRWFGPPSDRSPHSISHLSHGGERRILRHYILQRRISAVVIMKIILAVNIAVIKRHNRPNYLPHPSFLTYYSSLIPPPRHPDPSSTLFPAALPPLFSDLLLSSSPFFDLLLPQPSIIRYPFPFLGAALLIATSRSFLFLSFFFFCFFARAFFAQRDGSQSQSHSVTRGANHRYKKEKVKEEERQNLGVWCSLDGPFIGLQWNKSNKNRFLSH